MVVMWRHFRHLGWSWTKDFKSIIVCSSNPGSTLLCFDYCMFISFCALIPKGVVANQQFLKYTARSNRQNTRRERNSCWRKLFTIEIMNLSIKIGGKKKFVPRLFIPRAFLFSKHLCYSLYSPTNNTCAYSIQYSSFIIVVTIHCASNFIQTEHTKTALIKKIARTGNLHIFRDNIFTCVTALDTQRRISPLYWSIAVSFSFQH